jgi:hypothetical protein
MDSICWLALQALLGSGATTSWAVREHHGHGESYHAWAVPDIVCFPETTEEGSEILKISAKYRVPVILFGAGTSLEGHVHAIRGGITIAMRKMNKIVRIRPEDLDVKVLRPCRSSSIEITSLTVQPAYAEHVPPALRCFRPGPQACRVLLDAARQATPLRPWFC